VDVAKQRCRMLMKMGIFAMIQASTIYKALLCTICELCKVFAWQSCATAIVDGRLLLAICFEGVPQKQIVTTNKNWPRSRALLFELICYLLRVPDGISVGNRLANFSLLSPFLMTHPDCRCGLAASAIHAHPPTLGSTFRK
jgi:hypothetical protein